MRTKQPESDTDSRVCAAEGAAATGAEAGPEGRLLLGGDCVLAGGWTRHSVALGLTGYRWEMEKFKRWSPFLIQYETGEYESEEHRVTTPLPSDPPLPSTRVADTWRPTRHISSSPSVRATTASLLEIVKMSIEILDRMPKEKHTPY